MKNLIFFRSLFFLLTTCVVISSCHFSSTFSNREIDKEEAEKITNRFYDLLKEENFKSTYSLFSNRFYEVTDTSKLDNIFKMTNEKLGTIESINLDKWETQVVKGTNARSNYAFLYVVKHKKFDSKETITLSKENGEIKIIGYNVNSDGFFASDTK